MFIPKVLVDKGPRKSLIETVSDWVAVRRGVLKAMFCAMAWL